MPTKSSFSERELAEAKGAILASHEHVRWALERCTGGPDQFFSVCVEHAQRGDNWAAREVLHSFCTCFENGWSIPDEIKRYLYLGFSKYLAREKQIPLENALGLTAPPHRKKGARNRKGKDANDIHPEQLVANVYLLMKRDGLKKGVAMGKIVDTFRISKRQLQIYDRENNVVRTYPMELLLLLVQPVAEAHSANK